MTEIWVSFTLECSHTLEQPIGFPKMHGHSYWVKVFYESSTDNPVPLPMLQGFADQIKHRLDHKHLNDIFPVPTMESIAEYVFTKIDGPKPTKVEIERKSVGVGCVYVG